MEDTEGVEELAGVEAAEEVLILGVKHMVLATQVIRHTIPIREDQVDQADIPGQVDPMAQAGQRVETVATQSR